MGVREFVYNIFRGSEHRDNLELGEYLELQVSEGEYKPGIARRYVKVCKLKGFADVDTSARELSDGNIVILDIKPLAERSMNELKHAVDELKDICTSMGGDIAGLSEYQLIMTPPTIGIERSSESKVGVFEDTIEKIKGRKI